MDAQPAPECFDDAYWALRNNWMTPQAFIDLITSHFDGTRHPEDSNLDELSVKKAASHDLVGAAAKVCMADSSCAPSASVLSSMLLICSDRTNTSVADLERVDDEAKSVLASPALVQLLVAFCITIQNKQLAKALIAVCPQLPPSSQAIFGPPEYHSFRSHTAIEKHKDNACDVWLKLVNAGWVKADKKMFGWVTASPFSEDGVSLAGALVERGLSLERQVAEDALRSGPWGMVPFALEHYTPSGPKDKHILLRNAAVRQPPEEAIAAFQLLFEHGISDLNWMDDDTHVDYILNNWPLGDPRGLCEMSYNWSPEQSVLHSAVMDGHLDTIEWLVRQGAKSQYDGWGRNPHDTARFQKRTEAMELLTRLGIKGTSYINDIRLWDPSNTVQQAMALRRKGMPGQTEWGCVVF